MVWRALRRVILWRLLSDASLGEARTGRARPLYPVRKYRPDPSEIERAPDVGVTSGNARPLRGAAGSQHHWRSVK